MKKLFILILFFHFYELNAQISDTYYVDNIPEKFTGVYLPVEYISTIEETKSHSVALAKNKLKKYHDVLCVLDNIVYSNLKWHDQYAIKAKEIEKYEFKELGSEKYIFDVNGNKYKKIANKTKGYSKAVRRCVLQIIFQDKKNIPEVEISDDTIFIKGTKYRVLLDEMFFQKGNNIILFSEERNLILAVVIESDYYVFYKMEKSGEIEIKNTEEIIYKIKIN